ncbi:MAG: hypothetical protein ACP5SI_09945 [Chloroflexia bacterium]
MRAVRTFILRILVNSAEPRVLRGDVRPMPEGESRPFTNEEALLALPHLLLSQDEPTSSARGTRPCNDRKRKP